MIGEVNDDEVRAMMVHMHASFEEAYYQLCPKEEEAVKEEVGKVKTRLKVVPGSRRAAFRNSAWERKMNAGAHLYIDPSKLKPTPPTSESPAIGTSAQNVCGEHKGTHTSESPAIETSAGGVSRYRCPHDCSKIP